MGRSLVMAGGGPARAITILLGGAWFMGRKTLRNGKLTIDG